MYVRSQAHTPVKHLWKIKHTPARDKVNHAVLLQTIRQFLAQPVPAYSPCKDAIQIAGRAKPHWKALSKQMKGVCQVRRQQADTAILSCSSISTQYHLYNLEKWWWSIEVRQWQWRAVHFMRRPLTMSYLVHLNFNYLFIYFNFRQFTYKIFTFFFEHGGPAVLATGSPGWVLKVLSLTDHRALTTKCSE